MGITSNMTLRTDILPEELTQEQSFVVERIISTNFNISALKNQDSLNDQRLRQPNPAQDIDGFIDILTRVVEEQQNEEDIALENRVQVLYDFASEDILTEVISVSLNRRTPGSFSQGQPFNQNVRELKPHVRGIENDKTRPGYAVIILGQKFENEIILTCWAKTNKQANRRARWLEDLMANWRWYFRYLGVEECLFVGQDADMTLKLDSIPNPLHGRPLRFYVRTERITNVLEPVIRRIIVTYGLVNNITNEI